MTRALLALLFGGCAVSSSYYYSPQGATFWFDGYPVVAAPVSRGKVEVASFGVSSITSENSAITALHVRFALVNGDPQPWTLATADQAVELPEAGLVRPVVVNSDREVPAIVTIQPRERRVLDFYFPLPASIKDDEALPAFDFLWQVTTPARPIAGRTRFRRVEQEPPKLAPVVGYADRDVRR